MNSNPETVSTDYDTSDRLYLEPVTLERVLDVCALEQPLGVVVTLGGQTPLGLAHALAAEGVPLLGDPLPAIDAAEDRGRFGEVLGRARPPRAALGRRLDAGGGLAVAAGIGYPVLVRPHYVLGGRRMHLAASARAARRPRAVARRRVPRGCDRDRRGRALRRRGGLGGRRPRARRGGGRPLGRLGVRHARRRRSARRSRPRSPPSPRHSRGGCAFAGC